MKAKGKGPAPTKVRHPQLLAAKKSGKAKAAPKSLHATVLHPVRPASLIAPAVQTRLVATPVPAPELSGFNGSVFGIVGAGHVLLASTSQGLLTSPDDGLTWSLAGATHSEDWSYIASARNNVVSASLREIHFSADQGVTWTGIRAPEEITQISSIAVEPSGAIWVGGREGLLVSSDAGKTWVTPKNLYVTSIANLFYDEPTDRMLVTTGGADSVVFTVQLSDRKISYAYTGWTLRFARPVGDHIVAATLFDGIVVQPRMMDAPTPAAETSQR